MILRQRFDLIFVYNSFAKKKHPQLVAKVIINEVRLIGEESKGVDKEKEEI